MRKIYRVIRYKSGKVEMFVSTDGGINWCKHISLWQKFLAWIKNV